MAAGRSWRTASRLSRGQDRPGDARRFVVQSTPPFVRAVVTLSFKSRVSISSNRRQKLISPHFFRLENAKDLPTRHHEIEYFRRPILRQAGFDNFLLQLSRVL